MNFKQIQDKVNELESKAKESEFFTGFLKSQKKTENYDVLRDLYDKKYSMFFTILNPRQIKILIAKYRFYRISMHKEESSEALDWELMKTYMILKASLNAFRSGQIIDGVTNVSELKKEQILEREKNEKGGKRGNVA